MTIVFWSTFFMLITSILCTLGLLSRTFKDNLWQTVGMWAGMIGCGSRVPDIWSRTDIPFDWFLVHLCLGLFSIGTAWKVLRVNHHYEIDNFVGRFLHVGDWHTPSPHMFRRRRDD